MDNSYYVYAHYKSNGTIFYVGKGKGYRAWVESPGQRSKLWLRTAEKHGLTVKIWAENLTNQQALDMEKEWIQLYGRVNIKTGPLVNLTDGGDGGNGIKGKHHYMYGKTPSVETRKKISVRNMGEFNHNYGKITPEKTKQRIRESLLNRHILDEERKKMSESRKGVIVPARKTGKSGHRYIYYHNKRNNYRLIIMLDSVPTYYGSFKKIEDAIKIRDEVLKQRGKK